MSSDVMTLERTLTATQTVIMEVTFIANQSVKHRLYQKSIAPNRKIITTRINSVLCSLISVMTKRKQCLLIHSTIS